ncbi:glycosyltransferase family 2 protein [Thalassorhabdus alkalitolerans]|uniref:Glycosyltransferase family 2 protein n=1 Tax=Thalassorhabdus alkalitolerans TaxID=2282697 RepID=A0ABW0YJ92_9BACI
MLISVVMAVYNEETYVAEAVSSILNQTYKNFEFIIVNDGSTDNTKSILEQYKDSRIKILELPKNIGVANARNIGVKNAIGDWIAVQDADDVSLPNRLEECASFIKEHPRISAVSSLIECIPGSSPLTAEKIEFEENIYNRFDTGEKVKDALYYGCPICHGSAIFSKAVFEKVGGYNLSYKIGHDYDLWIQLSKILPIEKLPKKLYQFRFNENSVSRSDVKATCNEVILISSVNICEYLKIELDSPPTILVFGTEQANKNFKKRIKPQIPKKYGSFNYIKHEKASDITKAYSLFRKKKFNALLMLDHEQAYEAKRFFKRQGLKKNQDFFVVWNITND